MASSIQTLAEKVQATFSKSTLDESFSEDLTDLMKSVDNIQASDLNFNLNNIWDDSDPENTVPIVGFPIYGNPTFSMDIFALQDGAQIHIHDHPGMYGIIKVIQGTVRISSYSKIPNTADVPADMPDDIVSELENLNLDKYSLIPVELHRCKDVTCKDDPCVLTPEVGNYHEIRALSGIASMLEILAPPYSNEGRECRMYSLLESKGKDSQSKLWLSQVSEKKIYLTLGEYTGPEVSI